MDPQTARRHLSQAVAKNVATARGARRGRSPLLHLAAALLISASVATGCGSANKDAPANQDTPPAPTPSEAEKKPTPKVTPGVQDNGEIVSAVPWFEGSLEQALAEATKTGKLVFIDVGAYWCPPCHELDEKVFVDPKVGSFLGDKFVSIHIDAEKGEGPDIVDRYRVQAYPTMLVLEPTGVEKGRLVDSMEPAKLIEAVGKLAAGENVLAELEAKVAAAPKDLKARYELAHGQALAARRKDALASLSAVIAGDPDNTQGLAAKAMYDTAMFVTAKIDGDGEKAVQQFRDLQAKFPASKQSVRAYRQIGRQLCKLGKPDEAIASLDKMIALDPDNADLKGSYGWFSFRQKCR
ncbi:MAG: tetratricopeptide repeat protein, partial [Nannocystaceae bacterium]